MNLRDDKIDQGSPKMRSRAAKSLVAFAASAALALTGCAASSSADAAPKTGGTLQVVQAAAFLPATILGLRGGNYPWILNVFQPLTQLDKDGKPQPVLATDWEFAEDGLSMTVNLREGVNFHSGRPMTAEDVKWTFEKTLDPSSGSQLGFVAKQFASIDIQSPTTVKVTFKKKINQATIFDYFEMTYIVDKESYAGLADGTQVIGTGPFKWGTYRPGVSLELTRNDEYWDKDNQPYLDKIEFQEVNDPTAQVSAIRSGRAGVAYGLGHADAQAFASDPQFEVVDAGGTIFPLGVDVTKEPFTDVRVRQALAYAIDRDRVNQQAFGGTGTVTDLFWGANAPGIDGEVVKKYDYNPEKAKQLIQEAGAEGAAVPITVVTVPQIQGQYDIIANNLKAVGLNPSSVPVDETSFNSLQNQGKLGAAFILQHGQVGFGEATMLDSLPSLRANNPSHFASPEYERLRQAYINADEDGAADALSALTDYMLDQAFSVPILQAKGKVVVSKDLKGVSVSKRGLMLLGQASLAK